jgi:hypothetical protein
VPAQSTPLEARRSSGAVSFGIRNSELCLARVNAAMPLLVAPQRGQMVLHLGPMSGTRSTREGYTGLVSSFGMKSSACLAPLWSAHGDWYAQRCAHERQQTPYRCQSRNQGPCASISSCLRFAAERSLALSGLVSSTAKMRSSHLISAMVCSVSIRHLRLTACYAVSAPTLQCAPSESTNCASTPPKSYFLGVCCAGCGCPVTTADPVQKQAKTEYAKLQ